MSDNNEKWYTDYQSQEFDQTEREIEAATNVLKGLREKHKAQKEKLREEQASQYEGKVVKIDESNKYGVVLEVAEYNSLRIRTIELNKHLKIIAQIVKEHPKNVTISSKEELKHELFDTVIEDLCKQPFPDYLF